MGTEPERVVLNYAAREPRSVHVRAAAALAAPTLVWACFVFVVMVTTLLLTTSRGTIWLAAILVVPSGWLVRHSLVRRRQLTTDDRRAERLFLLFSIAWPQLVVAVSFHQPRGCVHTQAYAAGPIQIVHTVNHGVPLDAMNLGGDWYLVLE